MRLHTYRETHGIRIFWRALRVEFYWWPLHLAVALSRDCEGWHGHVRVGPLSLFVTLNKWPIWTGGREFSLYVGDWTIRMIPFGRHMEWRAVDPWWVRGVSLNIPDVILGRAKYSTELVADRIACTVPMPEGQYAAMAKVERATWKRPRWFAKVRTSVSLEIPKGIPHAGKGENSWDCGDDGLFGIGGDSVEDAIRRARESVLRDRKRYGPSSPQAVIDALS